MIGRHPKSNPFPDTTFFLPTIPPRRTEAPPHVPGQDAHAASSVGRPHERQPCQRNRHPARRFRSAGSAHECLPDRKSTRLNSSHANISYAVFCLKKTKFLIS